MPLWESKYSTITKPAAWQTLAVQSPGPKRAPAAANADGRHLSTGAALCAFSLRASSAPECVPAG